MSTRVIIDANIFISYVLSPDDSVGTVAQTVESIWSVQYRLVFPDRLAVEIRSTIERKPHLRSRIDVDEIDALIEELQAIALPFQPDHVNVSRIVRDPKGDYLLDAAFGADVDYLVTGDRDLLDFRDELERPRIVTAAEFLGLFSEFEP